MPSRRLAGGLRFWFRNRRVPVLAAAQVIPFLTHADPWVRDHAARYLSEADDPSPATAEDFWRAIDALGPDTDAARLLYTDLSDMPHTAASTCRLIEAARKVREKVR